MYQTAADILAKVDIASIIKSYIKLTPAGDNFKARCCFHRDNFPSLSVSPRLGIFKCFSPQCDAKGNAANFISLYENISYYEALAILAKKIGRPDLAPRMKSLEFETIFEMNEHVLGLYQRLLFSRTPLSNRGREFIKSRRITQETARHFGLGYSPNNWVWLANQELNKELLLEANLISQSDAGLFRDFFKNRIIFPIYHNKRLVGFVGRSTGTAKKIPKYLNSRDSDWFKKRAILYGWDKTRDEVRKTGHVIIVEGQLDLIQLYQRGLRNTVAVSGSYFGDDQAKFLSKMVKEATIFSDGDRPGIGASIRVGEHLLNYGIFPRIIFVRGKDPDDLAKHRKRFNWEKLNREKSYSYPQFVFKAKGLEEALRRVSAIPNKIKLSYTLRELAELSGYDESHLEQWLIEYKKAPLIPPDFKLDKIPLALEDELIILSAITENELPLDDYLKTKLSEPLLDQIDMFQEGLLQELVDDPKYADRIHILAQIQDIDKYALDLINRLRLQHMEKDMLNLKEKFRSTKNPQLLDELEIMVRQINKLKSQTRNGKGSGHNVSPTTAP